MRPTSQISVRGLAHVYRSGHASLTALVGIDLDIEHGAFVSIIGPSGGGKTTLLKAVGGLLEPTRGTVTLDGMRPREAQERKHIGFVFQDPSLLPWRTVIRNVILPLELNGRSRSEAGREPDQLLQTVGLSDFRDYYPHQLSGGMKQRVALARAMALDPAVLLMDEPLGALDEMTRAAMRYELLKLWETSRKTVVMVTHSIPEAVLMSDRVIVLSSRPGRILGRLSIDLPRPRSESLERLPRFHEYVDQVRHTLTMGGCLGTAAAETPGPT